MTENISEEAAQVLFRDMADEAKAKDSVAGPLIPKWAEYLCQVLVIVAASYFSAMIDHRVVGIAAGISVAGFIALAFQVWGLRKRLDAVVVLLRVLEARERSN